MQTKKNNRSPIDRLIDGIELLPVSVRLLIAIGLALVHFLFVFYDSQFGQGQFLTPETTIQELFIIRVIRSPLLFLYSSSFLAAESIISILLYALALFVWLLFWILPGKTTFYITIGVLISCLLLLEIFTQIGCMGAGC
jgi:hypothetical protein